MRFLRILPVALALIVAGCASNPAGIDAARRAHALYPMDRAERLDGRCEPTVAVLPGESLSDIAQYCDVPLGSLISYNMQIHDPHRVPPGALIRIPDERGDIYSRPLPPPVTTAHYEPPYEPERPILNPDERPLDRGVEKHRPSLLAFLKPNPPARPIGPGDSSIVGLLTNEGMRCPTLRDDRGRLYTLLGDLRGYRNGDRILVRGTTAADDRICKQAEAVYVYDIESAPW